MFTCLKQFVYTLGGLPRAVAIAAAARVDKEQTVRIFDFWTPGRPADSEKILGSEHVSLFKRSGAPRIEALRPGFVPGPRSDREISSVSAYSILVNLGRCSKRPSLKVRLHAIAPTLNQP